MDGVGIGKIVEFCDENGHVPKLSWQILLALLFLLHLLADGLT
jgi:hypothetical protein